MTLSKQLYPNPLGCAVLFPRAFLQCCRLHLALGTCPASAMTVAASTMPMVGRPTFPHARGQLAYLPLHPWPVSVVAIAASVLVESYLHLLSLRCVFLAVARHRALVPTYSEGRTLIGVEFGASRHVVGSARCSSAKQDLPVGDPSSGAGVNMAINILSTFVTMEDCHGGGAQQRVVVHLIVVARCVGMGGSPARSICAGSKLSVWIILVISPCMDQTRLN